MTPDGIVFLRSLRYLMFKFFLFRHGTFMPRNAARRRHGDASFRPRPSALQLIRVLLSWQDFRRRAGLRLLVLPFSFCLGFGVLFPASPRPRVVLFSTPDFFGAVLPAAIFMYNGGQTFRLIPARQTEPGRTIAFRSTPWRTPNDE
jgi:hypothetical protein